MAINGWTIDTTGLRARHNVCGRSLENKPQYIEAHIGICVVAASAKTSKGDTMATDKRSNSILVEFKDGAGNLLGSLVGARRTFSSGSSGYGCYGKIGAKGSSQGYYQVSANIVEVGTKPVKVGK